MWLFLAQLKVWQEYLWITFITCTKTVIAFSLSLSLSVTPSCYIHFPPFSLPFLPLYFFSYSLSSSPLPPFPPFSCFSSLYKSQTKMQTNKPRVSLRLKTLTFLSAQWLGPLSPTSAGCRQNRVALLAYHQTALSTQLEAQPRHAGISGHPWRGRQLIDIPCISLIFFSFFLRVHGALHIPR